MKMVDGMGVTGRGRRRGVRGPVFLPPGDGNFR
jgi:hypothetical protein